MARFDALFFDMDGTLVENSSLMPGAFQQGFANQGLKIQTTPWKASGCTDWEVMDIFLSDFPQYSVEQKEELKEKIAPDVKRIVIDRVKQQGLQALPGVRELIKKLVELGITPGLLTGNMEEIVGPKLAAAGMDRKDFPYGGFGDHCPKRVDAARKALESASSFFGHVIDPARALVIGDTPNDIACARAVGASVLAVATGKFSMDELLKHDPDFLLKDLSDPNGFLEILREQCC
ncbi:MAG: HAD hydrolase-like protein [Anaerolineaceae bacterium]|nr:HAD hydrolase-like protein [Anaerolineaceae bacterium]